MPLKSATNSPASSVTRIRHVESLRVREISSAAAVSLPEPDRLEPGDIGLAGDRHDPVRIRSHGKGKIGQGKQRATLQDPHAVQMARSDGHLGTGEAETDFRHPYTVLLCEPVSLEELRDMPGFRPPRRSHQSSSSRTTILTCKHTVFRRTERNLATV